MIACERMAQILVRNIDDEVVERLKSRAAVHGRSLEAEVRQILEQHSKLDPEAFWKTAHRIKQQFKDAGVVFSDSTDLVREDRDR